MSSLLADALPFRAGLRARVRAIVLLAIVLDVPVARRLVSALTGPPSVETTEVDGVPVEIVRPARGGPWSAWIFINGAHPLRRQEPVVTRLSRGLARAGYLVVVPDLPGLGEGRITQTTFDAAVAVADAAARLSDVRHGRVALVGASMGAGLALLVAARPELDDRVSVVAAVAPFADLRKLICLGTTRCYGDNGHPGRYQVTELHRRIVAGSLVALLSDGPDRQRLLEQLDRLEREDRDAIEHLSEGLPPVGPEADAVVRLLTNTDPARFGELYAALPDSIRSVLDELSPLTARRGLRARAELIAPPSDVYFPLDEAIALARALPTARLTITETLDHTRPTASLRQLRELRRFDGFVIRGLAAAASSKAAA